ncbi:O-acetylhomoserine aminocarboxypropyltransferase/cysteine synthase [bacterium]|nr:O-acetylhomoserine aminocarboxypropyltransferase/cysteine synthase [bacterium]
MAPWSFETRAIHSGFRRDEKTGATVVPIYQTASYSYDTAQELSDVFHGRKYGHVYSRITNPTVSALEARYNDLEGGVGAVALASGMAANTAVLQTLCEVGDHVVASSGLFGGTLHLLKENMRRSGVSVTFCDLSDIESFRQAITPATRAILVEIIGNPKLDVADVSALSELADSHRIPLIVDNTLSTAYLFDAKKFGVHIIVNCLGKYASGTGNNIGGIVVDMGTFDWKNALSPLVAESAKRFGKMGFIAALRKSVVVNTGACMAPFNAFLFMTGLETMALRMERHCENAAKLAQFLKTHPNCKEVRYPGLPDALSKSLVDSQFDGRGGAMLTIRTGSKERAFQLIDSLKLASNAANLGDSKTLVIHAASTIYKDFSESDKAAAGVYDDLIRVSVGIENCRDIEADFGSALDTLS